MSDPLQKAKQYFNPNSKSAGGSKAPSKYPERSADELGLGEYFKANPNLPGMAWGGGMNNTAQNEPRVVVANPFNPDMSDPVKRQGLLKLEAARHLMDEQDYAPQFKLTPEQQQWRKSLGAYATDDKAFKQSIISRLIVNDTVPGATDEQRKASQDILRKLNWEYRK